MVPVQGPGAPLGRAAPAGEELARVPVPEGWEIVLDMTAGPGSKRSFRVTRSRVLIGRGSVDVALPDPRVSRRHASLEVYGAALLLIKDLGSTNGTFVNGRRVTACELADGDEIRVGDTTLIATIGVPPK
jgi:pSer/pThr/pTyr-binding forkhead associated (FHA) protein